MPRSELIEEEALSLALKASMESAMKERAARIASSLFDDVPGTFPVSRLFFIYHVRVILIFMP